MRRSAEVPSPAQPVTGLDRVARHDEGDQRPLADEPGRRHRAVPWLAVATLVIGLAVTAVLALLSHTQYNRSEQRLLTLRVRDAAALVSASLPAIETPLASAAALAEATNGNVPRFQRFVAPLVHGPNPEFASVSLWRLSAPRAGPVAVAGIPPKLARSPSRALEVFAHATRSRRLSVVGLLSAPSPRLGYAFVTRGSHSEFVAYAESPLPADRRSPLQGSSAFTNLDYAIYLGATQQSQALLVTNLRRLPVPRPSAAQTVPFGDSALRLVMSSRTPLAGSLPRLLPWIIAALGLALSLAAALITLSLIQRRRAAEQLAGTLEVTARENRRLYSEQRGIAQTLQHALLPAALPQLPGIQASARYEAGEHGVEIGGDWYDVIDLGDRRLLLVVGDVTGRGLKAATTMASLRFAIRAYAVQGDTPAQILTKLSGLVSVADSGQLATVLCAMVEPDARRIAITSAGHLPALLLADGEARFVEAEVGLPIGVQPGASYTSCTVVVPDRATLVAYTDGLVELRGESLDRGLERLRTVASGNDQGLPALLDRLVTELANGPSEDDIAIVGVRWTAQNLKPTR